MVKSKGWTLRDKFVLGTLALALIWNSTSSLLGWGWITATVISFLIPLLMLGYAYFKGDSLLPKLLLFGIVGGLVELLADRYLVLTTKTLVYVPGGPFWLSSPLYMPFAWCVVLTQLAYIGWRFRQRFGLVWAMLLSALLGAVNIPLYEQWALGAQWWYYRNTPMLGATPWYIIAGEFLIVGALPWLLGKVQKSSFGWAAALGVVEGFWIWVCYALAFQAFGG